jgi:hypothetical protein
LRYLRSQAQGLGYTSLQWQASETLAYLRALPQDTPVYTNGADVAGYVLERRVGDIPARYDPLTMRPNPQFEREMQAMCAEVGDGRAVLVYFNANHWDYFPSKEELVKTCQLKINYTSDGALIR